MTAQFFYKNAERQTFGPFTVDSLRDKAQSGRLTKNDIVWLGGTNKQYKAADIKGLFDVNSPKAQASASNTNTALPAINVSSSKTKPTSMINPNPNIIEQIQPVANPPQHQFNNLPPQESEVPISTVEVHSDKPIVQENVYACPDCNGRVSIRAKSCPHCGAPLRKYKSESFWASKFSEQHILRWMIAYGIVALLLLIYGVNLKSSWQAAEERTDSASTRKFDLEQELARTYYAEDQLSIKADLIMADIGYANARERERSFEDATFHISITFPTLILLLGNLLLIHFKPKLRFYRSMIFGIAMAGTLVSLIGVVLDTRGFFNFTDPFTAFACMPIMAFLFTTGFGHSHFRSLQWKDLIIGTVTGIITVVAGCALSMFIVGVLN